MYIRVPRTSYRHGRTNLSLKNLPNNNNPNLSLKDLRYDTNSINYAQNNPKYGVTNIRGPKSAQVCSRHIPLFSGYKSEVKDGQIDYLCGGSLVSKRLEIFIKEWNIFIFCIKDFHLGNIINHILYYCILSYTTKDFFINCFQSFWYLTVFMHVVTAAHCIRDSLETVLLGVRDLFCYVFHYKSILSLLYHYQYHLSYIIAKHRGKY